MKNFIFLIAMSFLMSFPALGQLSGDTWEETLEQGQGTIQVSYVLTPAFVYHDDDGNLTGICVDIMNNFVRYIENQFDVNVTIEYVDEGVSFRESYDRVKMASGGVFGLGNITITEERREEIAFTPPIITNIAVLVTQDHIDDLTALENISEEFSGMYAYASEGTLQDTRIRDLKNNFFPDLEIRYTDSSGEALQNVIDDPSSFSYQDIALFWDQLQRGHSIKRHPVGDELSEQFGIIMPLDSDWAPAFNRFFTLGAGYRSTSEYRRILMEHLGPEVTQMLGLARN